MTWVKLDDGFYRHAKARAAGKDGRALFVASLCWCAANSTNGLVHDYDLAVLAAEADVKGPATARRLVDVGLWEPVTGGWVVRSYLEYNPSADHVADLKAKRAEAGRRGGQRSGQTRSNQASKREPNREANASATPEQTGEPNRTPSPIPLTESLLVVVSPPVPAAEANDDDDDLGDVVGQVARARAARLGRLSPQPAWLDAVTRSLRRDEPRIAELTRRGYAPDDIDRLLDGANIAAEPDSSPVQRPLHLPGTGPCPTYVAGLHGDPAPMPAFVRGALR